MKRSPVLLLSLLLLSASIASGLFGDPPSAALSGDSGRPASARWIRSELYFGVGAAGTTDAAAEARWTAFLDKEVTPRFPDGLTVLDGYGQWLDRGKKTPERLRSKVLIILHEDTPGARAAIDAIRVAWKAATHDQSVLLANSPVELSF